MRTFKREKQILNTVASLDCKALNERFYIPKAIKALVQPNYIFACLDNIFNYITFFWRTVVNLLFYAQAAASKNYKTLLN